MTPVYGARTIKRERRTNARLAQLDEQILDVLAGDYPQSVRHVFYRMTNPRLPEPVEKSDRGYRHVQARMVKLRRDGRLPFGWVTDATRRGYHTETFRDTSSFLRSVKALYRADLWRDAATYCEVWTESRSIAGVIEDDCRELAVSLYPAGGFTSISLAHQAAQAMELHADGRPIVVFYVGDYDPAGVIMDGTTERELREHLPPDVVLHFERLAITEQQILDYDLPTKPRKPGDRRALHVNETVEAEALPANVLRAILRQNVEALLPAQALHVARAEEDSAQAYFEMVANMGGPMATDASDAEARLEDLHRQREAALEGRGLMPLPTTIAAAERAVEKARAKAQRARR